jgi:hypothetical protein
MKKITALALIVFLYVNAMNAQLRFGVKAGANISSLSSTSDLINNVNATLNYQAGVLMQLKLGNFAIQPELLYNVKGGELENPIIAGNNDNKSGPLGSLTGYATKLDYRTQNIDIPVNFQYGMDYGAAHIYAQAGPWLSFQVAASLKDAANNTGCYTAVNDAFGFHKVDYGIGLGVGAEYHNVQLSVKYDFGLNEVGKEKLSSLSSKNLNPFYNMENRDLSISLAYLF